MENEYNDYLILSPNDMETIAKEYQRAMYEKKVTEDKQCHKEISGLIKDVIIKIGTLKNVCSKRFFMSKKDQVEDIDKKLKKLYYKFSNEEIENKNIIKNNFCSTLKELISKLSEIIEVCLNSKYRHDSLLNECILTCLLLIKDVSGLFGECRYRSLF